MAGYSPEQIALVIAAHARAGCGTVVPFTGPGVWAGIHEEVATCTQYLRVEPGLVSEPVVVDPADPADVFRKLVHWIRAQPTARCAIDCTGGKKPMDSGAAHAASFYGLPAYYLDFEDYDPQLRRPFPWTCRYRVLPLPDAVFGLEARKRIFETFRARRFGDARMAMREMLSVGRRSGFFQEAELADLQRSNDLIEQAAAWIDLRYQDLPGHPLHKTFSRSTGIAPRRRVEQLLAPERFDELFCYLADAYWRLHLLFDAGDIRETLVGLVALAELTIDRLFQEAWYDSIQIHEAVPLEWFGLEDERKLPNLDTWRGKKLPRGCVPPSSFTNKVKLMRRGTGTLSVWAWPEEGGADLRAPPPADEEPRLVVELILEVQSPPLAGPEGSNTRHDRWWKEHFGGFPQQGRWVQNRHALAHLPAVPLSEADVHEVRLARDLFVPRLMEVLRRVHDGEELDWNQVAEPLWVRWQTREPWRRENRAPWKEREGDLERWLWLRL